MIEYQIGEDQMEKKVIRSGVFVKVIGIITTAIFSLVSLFLAITGNIMASICFFPFIQTAETGKIQRYPMPAPGPSGQPDTDGPCGPAV